MQIPFAFVNKNCTEYEAKLSAAFTSEVLFCYILFPVHESFRTFVRQKRWRTHLECYI